MRRFILPIAAILMTAACASGNTTHAAPASSAAPTRTSAKGRSSAAKSAHSKPRTAKPRPSASTKDCPPTRDIIVWTKAPGLPDSAQELGNYNLETCEPTLKWLQHSSPTDAGYCTEAAWASDNPGYNADAEPAVRLKKVQVTIGPAC